MKMDHREERDASCYRDIISQALDTGSYFSEVIDLFYNGDYQPVYILVLDHKLTAFKQSVFGIKDNYVIRNNILDPGCSIYNITHDLARFLSYEHIERILNDNRHVLNERCLISIPYDEDRGYIPFIVYRDGPDDVYHIIRPVDDVLYLDKAIMESLSDVEDINTSYVVIH